MSTVAEQRGGLGRDQTGTGDDDLRGAAKRAQEVADGDRVFQGVQGGDPSCLRGGGQAGQRVRQQAGVLPVARRSASYGSIRPDASRTVFPVGRPRPRCH